MPKNDRLKIWLCMLIVGVIACMGFLLSVVFAGMITQAQASVTIAPVVAQGHINAPLVTDTATPCSPSCTPTNTRTQTYTRTTTSTPTGTWYTATPTPTFTRTDTPTPCNPSCTPT